MILTRTAELGRAQVGQSQLAGYPISAFSGVSVSVSLPGLPVALSLGTLNVAASATAPITGLQSTISASFFVTVQTAITVNLPGVQATVSLTPPTVRTGHDIQVPITGLQVLSSAGTISLITGTANVSLVAGAALTIFTQLGEVTAAVVNPSVTSPYSRWATVGYEDRLRTVPVNPRTAAVGTTAATDASGNARTFTIDTDLRLHVVSPRPDRYSNPGRSDIDRSRSTDPNPNSNTTPNSNPNANPRTTKC